MQLSVFISSKFEDNPDLMHKLHSMDQIKVQFFSKFKIEFLKSLSPIIVVLDSKDFKKITQKKKFKQLDVHYHLFIIFYNSHTEIEDLVGGNSFNREFYELPLLSHLPDILRAKQEHAHKLRQKVDQERFKFIVQNMPVMVDALDEDFNFVFWNRECEKITGYTAKEIVNNPKAIELLYPDSEYRQQLLNDYVKLGGNFRNWEMTLTTKTGQQKVIAWSNLSEIYQVPGWKSWAVGIDVTEKHRLQANLQKKEFILNTLNDFENIFNNWQTEEQICEHTLFRIREFVPFKGSVILTYNYQQQTAEIITSVLNNSIYHSFERPVALKSLIKLDLIKRGKVVYVDDIRDYAKDIPLITTLTRFGYRFTVIVPLYYEDQIFGSMSFFFSQPFQLAQEHEALLKQIGRKLARTIKQRRLISELNERIIQLEKENIKQINELKEQKSRLRAQFDNLPLPTLTWRRKGDDFILIDYNDMALANSFGQINKFIGLPSKKVYPFIPQITDLLEECFQNQISIETQVKVNLENEDTSYLSIKLAYAAPDSILMHVEDITEQKTNEMLLQKTNQLVGKQRKTIDLLKEEKSILQEKLFPVIAEFCNSLWENRDEIKNKHFLNLLSDIRKRMIQYLEFFEKYYSFEVDHVDKTQVNLNSLITKIIKRMENDLERERIQILKYFDVEWISSDEKVLQAIFDIIINLVRRLKQVKRHLIIRIISLEKEGKVTLIIKDNSQGLSPKEFEVVKKDRFHLFDLSDHFIVNFLVLRKLTKIIDAKLNIDSKPDEGCQFEITFESHQI